MLVCCMPGCNLCLESATACIAIKHVHVCMPSAAIHAVMHEGNALCIWIVSLGCTNLLLGHAAVQAVEHGLSMTELQHVTPRRSHQTVLDPL